MDDARERNSPPPPFAVGPFSALPRVRLVAVEQFDRVAEGPPLRAPSEVRDALRSFFEFKDREMFVVLHLDASNRVTTAEVVTVGILNASLVHPREVFKAAILANAAAIICAHNHPSGELKPSEEDRRVFENLRAAGDLLRIRLLDFVIVGGNGYWSALNDPSWHGG